MPMVYSLELSLRERHRAAIVDLDRAISDTFTEGSTNLPASPLCVVSSTRGIPSHRRLARRCPVGGSWASLSLTCLDCLYACRDRRYTR
jgi:hypothetical protein